MCACPAASASHLQLLWSKRRVGSANLEDIDQTACSESLDAPVLVAEDVRRGQLLSDLVERLLVLPVLVQVGQLFGELVESLDELGGRYGPTSAPGQWFVELEAICVALLVLWLLGRGLGCPPASRHCGCGADVQARKSRIPRRRSDSRWSASLEDQKGLNEQEGEGAGAGAGG